MNQDRQNEPYVQAQAVLAALRAGQIAEAEELCMQLLHAAPAHPDGLHTLGALRLKQGRAMEAIAPLAGSVAWLQVQPASPQRDTLLAAWLADWGLALNALERLPEALQKWQQSLQLHPMGAVRQWAHQAEQLLAAQAGPSPAATPEKSTTLKSNQAGKKAKTGKHAARSVQAWLDQAIAAYQQGHHDECMVACQHLLASRPGFAEALHLMAAVYRSRKDWPAAREVIARTLQAAPGVAAYWNTAGLIASDTGDYAEAKARFEKALALDGNLADAWNHLGITWRDLKNDDEAERCYRRALQLNPHLIYAWLNLSGLLHHQGRLDEAHASLQQALAQDASKANLWGNLGVVLKDMGRLDEAEAAYRKALALAPQDASFWMNLGNLLDETDRLAEGLAAKERALQLAPGLATAWLNYGNVLKKLGREQEAAQAYQKAIALNAHEPKAYNNLANCYRNFGHHDKAIELYQQAIALNPDFAEAYCGLGCTYQDLEDNARALGFFEKALALAPDIPDIALNMAMALGAQEQWARAYALLDQAQAAKPDDGQVHAVRASIRSRQGALPEAMESARQGINLLWRKLQRQDTAMLADSSKPPMDVSNAGDALLDLKRFLDGIGVPFFLAYGTLLGIYRDGDLLPFDKDMDVGIGWDIDRQWLIDQVQASGVFWVKGAAELDQATRQWNFPIVHKATGVLTDFFFFKPDGHDLLSGFHHAGGALLWRFSQFERGVLSYRGVDFPAPRNPDAHLAEIYGEQWRIPDPYFDSVVSGRNLEPHCRELSMTFAYLRLFDRLQDHSWKKAYGYCKQLFKFQDDPWMHELADWLQVQQQNQECAKDSAPRK